MILSKTIEEVLKNDPETRSNNTLLVMMVWLEVTGKDTLSLEDVPNLPPPETIRRTRAKLQEQGLYTDKQAVPSLF